MSHRCFLGILTCVSLCLRKIRVAIFVLRLSVVMCSMEVLQVCICAEWDLGPQQGMLTLHTPWMNTQQMTMRSFRKQGNNDLIYSVDSSFIYIYCVCARVLLDIYIMHSKKCTATFRRIFHMPFLKKCTATTSHNWDLNLVKVSPRRQELAGKNPSTG